MATSYSTALSLLREAAQAIAAGQEPSEAETTMVSLWDAVGRVAARDHRSPISTPEFDSSAMDGYAVRSEATKRATPENPIVFQVEGTIAAGDGDQDRCTLSPAAKPSEVQDAGGESHEPCVEIMTGARFPEPRAGEPQLDACVKLEDVIPIAVPSQTPLLPRCPNMDKTGLPRYIAVTRPVRPHANRRFAWHDILQGDVLLKAGQLVTASHLMALASVGIESVAVRRRPRVGIWSTGKELVRSGWGNGSESSSRNSRIRDINGVYLTAACHEHGAEATFLGTLEDTMDDVLHAIRRALTTSSNNGRDSVPSSPEILITSGGVSVGKFDLVRLAIEHIPGAQIVFHGLAIRPGHPVLFARLPSSPGGREVAFFGLPGNPGAAAACFRFLVVPYLRRLLGRPVERPIRAVLKSSTCLSTSSRTRGANGSGMVTRTAAAAGRGENGSEAANATRRPQFDKDRFQAGFLWSAAGGESAVSEVGRGLGPSNLSPFKKANCWIYFAAGKEYGEGALVECYPMPPQGFGFAGCEGEDSE